MYWNECFIEILHAENVKGMLEAVEQEVKLCDEVESVN